MGQYTIELTPEEEKALLTDMVSIETWLSIAIHHKAKKCIDKIVMENSDKQPDKISSAERDLIVRETEVKTAAERNEELLFPKEIKK